MNLKIRPDRIQIFQANFSKIPGFDNIEVVNAIHGDTVKHPPWWTAGNGAWGCYRSHVNLLEQCMNNNEPSYMVFEDDAIPTSTFLDDWATVLEELPSDWDLFYLGGQLLHEWENPPKRISKNIYIPYNVNRTHGFMVNQKGYERLYHHLMATPFEEAFHIDHHLGRIHETRGINVYVPGRWLIGQNGSSSNVDGKIKDLCFWSDPEVLSIDHWLFKRPVVICLHSSPEIAEGLRERGWHQGNWLNEYGLDRGVCHALNTVHPHGLLEEWYNTVRREVVRDNKKYPCLYHPNMSPEIFNKITFAHIVHIEASSVEEAEAKAKLHPLLLTWNLRQEQNGDQQSIHP